MSRNASDVSVTPEIMGQILSALQNLLREIPVFGTLKLELVIHAGVIKRIKVAKEMQTELSAETKE
jgi:hypothetical protein